MEQKYLAGSFLCVCGAELMGPSFTTLGQSINLHVLNLNCTF